MEEKRVSTGATLRLIPGYRPRVLLVDGDLGRRATLAVALASRYTVHTAGRPEEAQQCAARTTFDGAVLDSAALERCLPRLVRALRARCRAVRLLVVAARHDVRGSHYAATLGVDGRLRRGAPTHAMADRIGALMSVGDMPAPFDRGVGRAIDLMAGDVTHLLDMDALVEATGIARPALADRFRAATGLTLADYVTRVRVMVAQHLLRDTCLSMTTLAELLGFADADELARTAGLSRRES